MRARTGAFGPSQMIDVLIVGNERKMLESEAANHKRRHNAGNLVLPGQNGLRQWAKRKLIREAGDAARRRQGIVRDPGLAVLRVYGDFTEVRIFELAR